MTDLDKEFEEMSLKDGEEPMGVAVRHGELRGQIMLTLQNTISLLGPLPSEHGGWVKRIIRELDLACVLGLGSYLQQCQENKNYDRLLNARREMQDLFPDWKEWVS